MLVEPADLTPQAVLALVREHWDERASAVAYAPHGAGAHHWVVARARGPRWFVTADDVAQPGRLDQLQDAYAAARDLAERGHHLVLPTIAPQDADDAVGVVTGHWLVTVTPYLDGESGAGEYADDNQRALVARPLGELHAAVPAPRTPVWQPGPPMRAELERLLDTADSSEWMTGPFGEASRIPMRENRSGLQHLLARFDGLAAVALEHRGSWVPTHGEAHTANVVWSLGGPRLVDWESLRVAPRERDLRTVLRGADGAEPLSAYLATSGLADTGDVDSAIDADLVELFDLEWTLWEVGHLAARFAAPHPGDDDDRRFHRALLEELAGLDGL